MLRTAIKLICVIRTDEAKEVVLYLVLAGWSVLPYFDSSVVVPDNPKKPYFDSDSR